MAFQQILARKSIRDEGMGLGKEAGQKMCGKRGKKALVSWTTDEARWGGFFSALLLTQPVFIICSAKAKFVVIPASKETDCAIEALLKNLVSGAGGNRKKEHGSINLSCMGHPSYSLAFTRVFLYGVHEDWKAG